MSLDWVSAGRSRVRLLKRPGADFAVSVVIFLRCYSVTAHRHKGCFWYLYANDHGDAHWQVECVITFVNQICLSSAQIDAEAQIKIRNGVQSVSTEAQMGRFEI